MDTEKYNEMQEKIATGKPVTDEGPYYHHVQWESYKGWAKGKFGGAVIGTIIGGLIGGAAALILAPALPTAIAGAAVLAFAGIGLYKGMEEFGQIGTVTGAVAAGLDTAERRSQLYMDNKVNEIKAELGDEKAKEALAKAKEPAYRTTHFVPPPDGTEAHGPIFWKVALVGLAVGIAAGIIFASGGLATSMFNSIVQHVAGESVVLSSGTVMALSAATFGAFGASFGINRDVFRKIFDTTDVLYRGRVGESTTAQMVTRTKTPAKEIENPAPVTYVPPTLKYPESNTHFRDAEIAKAQRALMEMDHTRMTPH
jgi:hypothetical protein